MNCKTDKWGRLLGQVIRDSPFNGDGQSVPDDIQECMSHCTEIAMAECTISPAQRCELRGGKDKGVYTTPEDDAKAEEVRHLRDAQEDYLDDKDSVGVTAEKYGVVITTYHSIWQRGKKYKNWVQKAHVSRFAARQLALKILEMTK